jgi:hypothetical protein
LVVDGTTTLTGNVVLNNTTTFVGFKETTQFLSNQSLVAIDARLGTMWYVSLNQNFTLNPMVGTGNAGRSITIVFKQDSTGGRVMTSSTNISWAGGENTLSTSPNAIDVVTMFFDGQAKYYASLTKGFV